MASTQAPPPGGPPGGPPLGRRIPRPVWQVINGFMRTALSLPFPTPIGQRLMLVSLTGRKTGRHYRQPVSYVRHGDALLTPGGGKWKLNLRPGQPTRLHVNGRDVTAYPELVSDPQTAGDLYAAMAAANPTVTRFSGMQIGPDGRPDPQRLAGALKYGFVIVRWHLSKPGA
ncbi:MAG TPA: nitroreductase/quinone reductase family protein [Trebonia sp.]|nr:nitroreductase/quinone reductase family protein [Trebonia sp.]